jgi:hypothetical protein
VTVNLAYINDVRAEGSGAKIRLKMGNVFDPKPLIVDETPAAIVTAANLL